MPQSDGQPQPQPFAARHEQPGRVGRKTAMPMMTSHNTATGRLSPQYGVAGNGASLAAAATTPAWACALKRALLRTRPYIRWWSCLFILCVIVTGIGVSNAVYREISGRERRELQRDLEVVARMDVQSGNEVFERITRSVLNLRIAFRIAPVGTLTFREFVDSVKILDRPQAATSFLWAPHVTAEERDAFESRTRAINSNETRFVNFTITDASRSSSQPSAMSFAVAPNRTEYFPLLYDWSSINMPVVDQPGVDFLNLPGISNISDAVASGLPLIRIFMAPPEHDRMGKELLIIIPVYETADFPPTVEARQQSILGLLSVGAGVGTLIDNVRRAPADLEMYIFDESNVLLYANANPSIPTAQSPADIGSVHGSRFDIVAQIADRTITIVCVPTQKLVDKNTSVNPVLFACLTGLGFMVILVASVCAIRTIVKGQEKVAMAERRRQCVNEMIGFVNHELRNPLNAIVGLIDHATMMMEDIVSAFARLSSVPDVDKSLATTNASMRTTCSAISHVRSGAASLEGGDGNGSKACLSRTSSMGSAASDLADKVGSVLRDLRDTGQMCSLMRHIVDDVLDIRRLEEGALKVLISPVSLDMLLDEVKAIVQPKLSEKPTLSLSVEGLGRDVFFRCDPVRVKQVLLNFVVNAIKYSDAGPLSVRVAATEDGERLRFSVQDHGRGIEDSKKPYLFQPFMQLNGAARHQGVGLGLYLCSMLVDAMCGEIGFDSTAGVGSTFWFEIPFDEAERVEVEVDVDCGVATSASDSDAAAEAAVGGTTHVHMVPSPPSVGTDFADCGNADREGLALTNTTTCKVEEIALQILKVNRVVLKRYIQHLFPGIAVDEAENGLVGLQLASDRDYEIVWMDVQMPVMDGIEATKRIRAMPQCACTSVIGITGDVTAEQVSLYHEIGMNDVCSKPVSKQAISDAIRRWRRNT